MHNLKQLGKSVADLNGIIDREAAIKKTQEAMQAGVDIIVQAGLSHGQWYGRPDVLMKVNLPSNLGPWSYEPADAKLARDTRQSKCQRRRSRSSSSGSPLVLI